MRNQLLYAFVEKGGHQVPRPVLHSVWGLSTRLGLWQPIEVHVIQKYILTYLLHGAESFLRS